MHGQQQALERRPVQCQVVTYHDIWLPAHVCRGLPCRLRQSEGAGRWLCVYPLNVTFSIHGQALPVFFDV